MKKNIFALFAILTTAIAFIFILIIDGNQMVTAENRAFFIHCVQGAFILGILITGMFEKGKTLFSTSLFSCRNLMLFSLCALLVSSVNQRISEFVVGAFVISSFIYFLNNRELFAISKALYIVLAYALFLVFGTIGTPGGFRVPEKLLSFFLIPLAFSFVNIEKNTSLRMLRYFFRAMMIFMMCTLIFWWYNLLFFKLGIIEWATQKVNIEGLSGYYWSSGWAVYNHPSYISMALVVALISGFYLNYKKAVSATISGFELITFILFLIFNELVMESRIGIVITGVVLIISGLYYLHVKKRYFKRALAILFVTAIGGAFFASSYVSRFTDDKVRQTDYTLAINYIKAHPWWGAGYKGQKAALTHQEELMKDVLPPIGTIKTYVHNQLLGNMVQFGVFGALALIILIGGLTWYSFRLKSYLLQLFLSVLLVFMCIEEPLYGQLGITQFTLFWSFFVHIAERNQPRKSIKFQTKKING